ncbi:transposase [Streptomyces sp. NPDC099050]|uniref:transposase n=1 Tax=Streptomyces sp. NPDC099050 TaxID=3366100 RepID=UPI00381FA84B
MVLSQHDLLRLLESLRSAVGLELVREVAERLLQKPIQAEATTKIGAEWGEHTDTRTTWCNGHRGKTVTTQAGDPELAIPKLRAGSFSLTPGTAAAHRPGGFDGDLWAPPGRTSGLHLCRSKSDLMVFSVGQPQRPHLRAASAMIPKGRPRLGFGTGCLGASPLAR